MWSTWLRFLQPLPALSNEYQCYFINHTNAKNVSTLKPEQTSILDIGRIETAVHLTIHRKLLMLYTIK